LSYTRAAADMQCRSRIGNGEFH